MGGARTLYCAMLLITIAACIVFCLFPPEIPMVVFLFQLYIQFHIVFLFLHLLDADGVSGEVFLSRPWWGFEYESWFYGLHKHQMSPQLYYIIIFIIVQVMQAVVQ